MNSEKCSLLIEAWNGIVFPGADLIFKHMEVPEVKPGFVWPDGADLEDLPDEAFTGALVDRWTVGWKAKINGRQWGNYIVLDTPLADPEIVKALRDNYENARMKIESGIISP